MAKANKKNNCSICELAVTMPSTYSAIETLVSGGRATGGIPAAVNMLAKSKITVSKVALEKHFGRRKDERAHKVSADNGAAELLRGESKMNLNADGSGSLETSETFDENPDWDSILRTLGVDPRYTKVKNDTIRVSARTIVSTDDDGNTTERIARSYSCALEPRDTDRDVAVERFGVALAEIRKGFRTPAKTQAPKAKKGQKPATFMMLFGDMQVGKSEGAGIEGVIERTLDAFERSIESYHQNRAMGMVYNQVVMAQMGDVIENVMGNYANQTFTVVLNKTDQEDLAMELLMGMIERVRTEMGLPITFVSVNSNHGEQSRGGGSKNLTSASDTVDRRMALDLERTYEMFGNKNGGPKVTFVTPNDNLVVPATFAGVNFAFAHGHGIGARAKSTTIQQELLAYDTDLAEANGGYPFLVNVWVTAHYHHYNVVDCGPYTHIQTPALDGGSDWFTNMSGKYSRPGMVTLSVSDDFEGGIDHVRPLWVKETPTPGKMNASQRMALRSA